MLSKEDLRQIVKQKIESDEKLGEHASKSGHLAYISYTVNDINVKKLCEEKTEIRYRYTLFVETEFTVYPDNPPMECSKTKVIVIDKGKNIIETTDK